MTHRRFDWLLGTGALPDNDWDVELLRTTNFAVVPSLGSLVPGWLLVVPKRPALNFSELTSNEKQELESLLVRIRAHLHRPGYVVHEFEHGSRYLGSVMGCGVDQAHLHVVPLTFDLTVSVTTTDTSEIRWSELGRGDDVWSQISRDREYYFVRNDSRSLLGITRYPRTQWIRKVIAKELGHPDAWDYRTELGLQNIRATKRMFALPIKSKS
jgi:ATP adenylyltransferase